MSTQSSKFENHPPQICHSLLHASVELWFLQQLWLWMAEVPSRLQKLSSLKYPEMLIFSTGCLQMLLSCNLICPFYPFYPVAQTIKHLPTMRETQVRSLGREDPLEKEMVTHSSSLAWKIPWTEKHGRLQSMGLQRVGHDWATSLHFYPVILQLYCDIEDALSLNIWVEMNEWMKWSSIF